MSRIPSLPRQPRLLHRALRVGRCLALPERPHDEHGISAAEAEEALLRGPLCQVDSHHSKDEQRYVALGETNDGRRLFVSFTVRRNRVRIISARPMSRRERIAHEQAKKNE